MIDFPKTPFLTDDFSPGGKGIDYLGMRNVNLIFLESELVSGINNATRDVGTYILGAWITWKFVELSKELGPENFTRNNFLKFSEAIEVAFSYATRDGSPVNDKYPMPRNRIGKNQKADISKKLTFKNMGRGPAASIFYAAQYGPSLRWLEFTNDTKSEDGRSAGFQIPVEDEYSNLICKHVDDNIRRSPYFAKLLHGENSVLTSDEIDDLGTAGLCSGFYTKPQGSLKGAVEEKIFPLGSTRRDTADLVIGTLKRLGPLTENGLRRVWYTGLTLDGDQFSLDSQALMEHSHKWGIFYSRQILRYALETMLCVLERAVDRGLRSIERVVETLITEGKDSLEYPRIKTFSDFAIHICQLAVLGVPDNVASTWSGSVGPDHDSFELLEFDKTQLPPAMFINALTMLAGWWLRLKGNKILQEHLSKLPDESGRIPMKELFDWLSERANDNLIDTCKDLMSEFVYAQHLRIGMSRLGEDGTRLRFSLGDDGISPTAKLDNFAQAEPPFMADRLRALIDLMEDLDYVRRDGDLVVAL